MAAAAHPNLSCTSAFVPAGMASAKPVAKAATPAQVAASAAAVGTAPAQSNAPNKAILHATKPMSKNAQPATPAVASSKQKAHGVARCCQQAW